MPAEFVVQMPTAANPHTDPFTPHTNPLSLPPVPGRVPAEFVVQSPTAANPPTLFLLLSDMSERVAAAAARAGGSGGSADSGGDSSDWDDVARADADLLRAAWPRLKAWYQWFNATQVGLHPVISDRFKLFLSRCVRGFAALCTLP